MDQNQTKKQIIDHYESLLYRPDVFEYYGQSHFLNFGYWLEDTPDQKIACENLMEKLLSFIPEKSGTILDVACGNGATTAYLLKYYQPENVMGINISHGQLEMARTIAPGCTFLLMDATQLEFQDNAIDNIICVEAAFHFDTREKFLKEAHRVLKPGGFLVLSDILVTLESERIRDMRTKDNYLKDLEEYEDLLLQVGFRETKVLNATKPCWMAHFLYLVKYVHQKFFSREIGFEDMQRYLNRTYRRVPDLEFYLISAARKI
ncbi:MAG: class I SAM-dependent methyltransferase [Deltaproteobacteria bacterium]|nr:class I SAM-dependent methyltransferase [Deltaproteobacteria bacterium]